MVDQSKLLECMEDIKNIAVASQNKLTQQEIRQYLSDLELTDEQMKAVYQYLGASQIQVEGYEYVPPVQEQPQETTENPQEEAVESELENIVNGTAKKKEKPTKAEINRQMYEEELAAIEAFSLEREQEMMTRFLKGEKELRTTLIENRLQYVMQLAKEYEEKKVLQEDVIAQGNLGLLAAMSVLEQGGEEFLAGNGLADMDKVISVLQMEVKQEMERMIDDTNSEMDWEDTILARTNLLHEAAKYLAQEIGRVATKEELSEYTKIPVEEIEDIMSLSEDARQVAKP